MKTKGRGPGAWARAGEGPEAWGPGRGAVSARLRPRLLGCLKRAQRSVLVVTWTYSEEYYKKYTRDTWNESADAYDAVARNLDKYTDRLLHHAALRASDRALDVASGLGEPAFTMAPEVASVLGVDLSER